MMYSLFYSAKVDTEHHVDRKQDRGRLVCVMFSDWLSALMLIMLYASDAV